jgi:hypothetical protein
MSRALGRRYGRSAATRAAILAAADRIGVKHDASPRRVPVDVDVLQRARRAAHRTADSALSHVVDGYIALRTRYGHSAGGHVNRTARGVIAAMERYPGHWETIRDAVRANVPASAGSAFHSMVEGAVARLLILAAVE